MKNQVSKAAAFTAQANFCRAAVITFSKFQILNDLKKKKKQREIAFAQYGKYTGKLRQYGKFTSKIWCQVLTDCMQFMQS